MKSIIATLLVLLTMAHVSAAETGTLDSTLEGLRPFLGNWRGEFRNSTPDRPIIDVSQWERALNGKAIRILHSINDGAYGGETLVTWDAEKKSIVYHYFTTAGFQTRGTMKIDGKKLVCDEIVTGNAEGTTEVKATMEMHEDGSMVSESKYLKNGEWVTGHAVTYKRAADAKPVFK